MSEYLNELRDLGIEAYVNDEPGDPNPGVILDTRDWYGRALTPGQTRTLAAHLAALADYAEGLDQ